MKCVVISTSAVVTAASWTGHSLGDPIPAIPAASDAAGFELFVQGSEQAVAEARYGSNTDNGDWEIGVGEITSNSNLFNQLQNIWTNGGEPEHFEFAYTADTKTVSFTVGGDSPSPYVLADPLSVTSLAIRIGFDEGPGTDTGNAAEVTDLQFDGMDIAPGSLSSDFDESGARLLFIDDVLTLDSEFLVTDFVLTGKLVFSWSAIDPNLRGSRPSFQVKVVEAVPEPASLALLGAGLLALTRRR